MKSAFISYLGSSPFYKVMDYLLENYLFTFSKTEIAREVNISRKTINKFWNSTLIKNKILIKTKRIGNATLYKLNLDSPIVKIFRILDLSLARISHEKFQEKIDIPIPKILVQH